MSKQLKQATTLYQSFREASPKKLIRLMVDVPRVCAAIGHVEAVEYRTTHGGKLELYRHDFQKGSRPLLCTSGDGRQLLLLGGHYKFTDRGIVDRDAKGKLIYDPEHGRAINPKSAAHKFTQREFAKYVKIFKPSRALQRKAIALIKHDRVGWAKAGWHRLFQAAQQGGRLAANPARKAKYAAPSKTCRTCGKPRNAPFRVYDKAGKAVEGCISADHDGKISGYESLRWHNRPVAKKHRAAVKRSGMMGLPLPPD